MQDLGAFLECLRLLFSVSMPALLLRSPFLCIVSQRLIIFQAIAKSMQKKEKREMNLDTQVLSPRGDLL